MGRLRSLIGAAFLIGSGVAQGSEIFCVQTFNAYGPAYGLNIESRTDALGEYLLKHGLCDILVLQEVWQDFHRSQFRQVSLPLDPRAVVEFSDDRRSDGYNTGLGLVSRRGPVREVSQTFAVNEDGALDWFREMLGVRKGYSLFRVADDPNSAVSQITFINTHLHHASESLRLAQILELGTILADPGAFRTPFILAGDLNATPGSLEWRLLVEVFGLQDSSPADLGCTYCAENPLSWDSEDRKIDYVFSRSSQTAELRPLESRIAFREFAGQVLSDHYGLESRFQIELRRRRLAGLVIPSFEKQIALLSEVREIFYFQGRQDLEPFQKFLDDLVSRFREPSLADPLIRHLALEVENP